MLFRILPVILGALLLFYLLPVQVKFNYHYQLGASEAGVEARILLGLIILTWTSGSKGWRLTFFHPLLTIPISLPVPLHSKVKKEKGQREKPTYRQIISLLKDWERLISKALPYCRRVLRLSRLDIESFEMEVGTGDAAETGILTGLIWSTIGMFQHHFYRHRGALAGRRNYTIIPHFNRKVLKVKVGGILRVRPGHIITVMGQLVANILWEKYGKGVDISGRTSNSGFNENCHGEYQRNG